MKFPERTYDDFYETLVNYKVAVVVTFLRIGA